MRAKNHFGPRDPDHFLGTLEDAFGSGSHQFPFLAIGGYLGTGPLGVSDLDFQLIQSTPGPTSPATQYASFAEAQQSLATGQPVGGLQLYMIQDVNTTTNVLVALICHADHSRPRSACGRSAIKKLLKRIK